MKHTFSIAWKFWLIAIWLCTQAWAEPTQIFFSFTAGAAGGLGRIEVDADSGVVLTQEIVYASPAAREGGKVAQTREGWAVLAVNAKAPGNLVIRNPTGLVSTLTISDKLDEIRVRASRAIVGGEEGGVYLIDLAEGRVLRDWQLKSALNPPGRRPEDVRFDPNGRLAWVTLQKDSKDGKRLGHRLVALDLETGEVAADLRLPRDRSELHFGRDGDLRQSGPGPEVVLLFPRSNTLLVTLDLYGAVGLMDLEAARNGEFSRWTTIPTSLDGSWGTAFPDRAVGVDIGGRDHALVLNAGPEGGAVLIDLASRKVAQVIPVGHGLYSPEPIPALGAIAAAAGGKLKRRGEDDVEKSFAPRPEVAIFEIREEASELNLRLIALDQPTHTLRAVAPQRNGLLLVNVGLGADQWIVIDAVDGQIRSRQSAPGRVVRLAPSPE